MVCSIAPGKVILFGEHFVVKGKPAIGVAVNVYAKACAGVGQGVVESRQLGLLLDLDSGKVLDKGLLRVYQELSSRIGLAKDFHVIIDSEIPIAAGMGSSAAVAVSTAHALATLKGVEPDKKLIWEVSFEAEKIYHVKPSGVDNTLSTYGGVLFYQGGEFKRVEVKWPDDIYMVIVDSGVKRSTGQVVEDVLRRYEKYHRIMSGIYDAAGVLVEEALKALERGDFTRLGELMDINHGLLVSLGVSTPLLDSLLWTVREAGALGAKICGAGRGGVIVAVVDEVRLPKVLDKISRQGLKPIVARIDSEGVRKT
ncbi:MAG: mevalonate kinase [Thermogladius sp.]|jgi:mevalonate kinase|nr:mevalonate kinase [Thermogladius sp.]